MNAVNQLYDIIKERLRDKKKEYHQLADSFKVLCENECGNTSCFERNSVGDLMVMNQLKGSIDELEHIEMVMRGMIKNTEEK